LWIAIYPLGIAAKNAVKPLWIDFAHPVRSARKALAGVRVCGETTKPHTRFLIASHDRKCR
jgi:hypothetical protein